jgi:4-methyl-5(b-hydroxyethyl)-thiazole monophosphate biosynthesis
MNKVLLLLAEGFEEIETVTPLDILLRGGVQVDSASLTPERIVAGGQKIRIQADRFLEECNTGEYDMLIIPGGGLGVQNLLKDDRISRLIQDFRENDKWIAAICAGPKVLAKAEVISDSRITSYPSVKEELVPNIKEYSEERVVVDGKIITSRGAGCAQEFGLMLLEKLTDSENARKVQEAIISALP